MWIRADVDLLINLDTGAELTLISYSTDGPWMLVHNIGKLSRELERFEDFDVAQMAFLQVTSHVEAITLNDFLYGQEIDD